jgi:hypothetical protein
MSDLDQFRTSKFHSVAKRMPLFNSDGTESKHYIDIIGIKSPMMRKKKQELIRLAAKNIKEGEWTDEASEKYSLELVASTIVSWSFDEEPTPEFVTEFLRDAPEIMEAIDVFCSNDENYFEKK